MAPKIVGLTDSLGLGQELRSDHKVAGKTEALGLSDLKIVIKGTERESGDQLN